MPAKSDKQRKFMNVVKAYQQGDTKNVSKDVKDAAKSMSKKDVDDFASTKGKLPKRIKNEIIRRIHEEKKRLFESNGINFNTIFHVKNKWVKVSPKDRVRLADEFFNLIHIAYSPIGGHIKIQSKGDLVNADWDVWFAIDFDDDPDAEIVLFGKTTKHGIKWAGVGHDGSKDSKRKYLDHKAKAFTKVGNYGEISEKLADILLSKGVPYVSSEEDIKAVLKKNIDFVGKSTEGHGGTGWYNRNIGGGSAKEKLLMGTPKGIKSLKKS